MKIAVLSGKGGAGKTFVSVNLAVAAGNSTYIDCDVEEPNGRLFLKPEKIEVTEANDFLPEFNYEKCSGCRKCVDFCHFNALMYVKKKPVVFPEVCHYCGGCEMVCPENAIHEVKRKVGIVEKGKHNSIEVITGIMDMGEVSAVPIIKAALREEDIVNNITIIDCPPGSGCPVMESVKSADCCIIVAEPTAFGFHNFEMVYELAVLMKKPCYVVINKESEQYMPLEKFCTEKEIPILLKIPFSKELGKLCADGKIVAEEFPEYSEKFKKLLNAVVEEGLK